MHQAGLEALLDQVLASKPAFDVKIACQVLKRRLGENFIPPQPEQQQPPPQMQPTPQMQQGPPQYVRGPPPQGYPAGYRGPPPGRGPGPQYRGNGY
jgi:hypothetical protein